MVDLEAGGYRPGVRDGLRGIYDTAQLLRAGAAGLSAAIYGGKRAYSWYQGESQASKRQRTNGNNQLLLARIMGEKRKASKYTREGSRKTYVSKNAELVSALKKSMGPAHYYDSWMAPAFNTTGLIYLVPAAYPAGATGIQQGAGNTQRVGKKIKFKYIQVRGYAFAGTGYVNPRKVFFALIYDRRPTGSLPTMGQIFDASSGLLSVPCQPNLDDHSNRFKILLRREYTFDGNALGGDASSSLCYPINETVKLGLPCVFGSAGTGAIGDIEQGAIYIVMANTDSTGGNSDAMVISLRTRFWDVL